MSFKDTIEQLERAQWQALKSVPDATAFFSEFLTADSRMAVPYGIGDRDRVLGSLETSPVILDFELKNTHVIKLSEDSAIIIYRMMQSRVGMEPFEAAISTVYVRREGRWLIAFHQQTPLVPD